MDELNLIQKGGDYGWPSCEGTSASGCGNTKFTKPAQTWPVANASPGGLAIVHDTLFMAALRGQRLYRMEITGDGTSKPVATSTAPTAGRAPSSRRRTADCG